MALAVGQSPKVPVASKQESGTSQGPALRQGDQAGSGQGALPYPPPSHPDTQGEQPETLPVPAREYGALRGHCRHEVELLYVPAGQTAGVVVPTGHTYPAGQGPLQAGLVKPGTLPNTPGGQGTQALGPPSEYVPEAHLITEIPEQVWPAGQDHSYSQRAAVTCVVGVVPAASTSPTIPSGGSRASLSCTPPALSGWPGPNRLPLSRLEALVPSTQAQGPPATALYPPRNTVLDLLARDHAKASRSLGDESIMKG